jgi:hypothetical protein
MDRLHERGGPRVVAQRPPDLADAYLQRTVADDDVVPDGAEQLLLGHEPAGVADEVAEDFERLGRQGDRLAAAE